ncbi:DUF1612 domain-containing protein [Roseibium aggregatum]|uniref:DUF1612 domain-containing protein n=1 Tax=Roseibium aggregatum TaxID=187304 RepID=UPI0025AD13D9|nr:hypothetical protein [Roseibium aggregatum]WJS06222.1 hypothetical protein QUB73_29620 [Roseibium aggregatum]
MTTSHLPSLSAGLRKSPLRWRRKDTFQMRIAGFLSGFEKAGQEAMKQETGNRHNATASFRAIPAPVFLCRQLLLMGQSR